MIIRDAAATDAAACADRRVGFRPVGVFDEAGHKLGRWRDVAWFMHDLS